MSEQSHLKTVGMMFVLGNSYVYCNTVEVFVEVRLYAYNLGN